MKEFTYVNVRKKNFDLVHKTEAKVQSSAEGMGGDIYSGCGEAGVMRYVVKMIKSMQDDSLQIRFHTYSANANNVTERLDKGLFAFGLLIGLTPLTKCESLWSTSARYLGRINAQREWIS